MKPPQVPDPVDVVLRVVAVTAGATAALEQPLLLAVAQRPGYTIGSALLALSAAVTPRADLYAAARSVSRAGRPVARDRHAARAGR